MSFSKDVYKEAFEVKKAARYKAQQTYDAALELLRKQNPEYAETEQKITALSAKIGIAVISGNREAAENLRAEIDALRQKNADMLSVAGKIKIEYECPLCEDTGYVGGKICSCTEALAKKIMAEKLSRNMPIDACRFDNFDLKYYSDKGDGVTPRKRMTQVLRVCREFSLSQGEGQNLLLFGKTGLGKTHLSLAVANEFLDRGLSVVYDSAQNLINALAEEQFSYSGNTELSDSVLESDLLIIDDLGAEMHTSFSASCVNNVINTRLLKNKPTIISTNLTLDEIEAVYSPRVLSRIIGGYKLLGCLGDDIRQQKALEKAVK